MDARYDHPTDQLVPCQCGFKPDHYSIYYSRTPYDVVCSNCKKQLNFARCKVTGHHMHVIDYWNKHLAALTKEEFDAEVAEFQEEREIAEANEGMRAKEYVYYWVAGKGPELYQRW
jgi:hypothetical protein